MRSLSVRSPITLGDDGSCIRSCMITRSAAQKSHVVVGVGRGPEGPDDPDDQCFLVCVRVGDGADTTEGSCARFEQRDSCYRFE